MAHFILQTFKGSIEHDFVFQMKKALDYHRWVYRDLGHTYEFSDVPLKEPTSYPIGDLEYVFTCLGASGLLNVSKKKPINVPSELSLDYYTKRLIHRSDSPTNPFDGRAFVKSNTNFKSFTDVLEPGESAPEIDNEYFFSEEIPIESEWRIFVHRKRVVGLGNYSGYPLSMPDQRFIENAVSDYRNSPDSYTIDIGINQKHNFIIEIHPFVSCGLYGFSDMKVLPQMFIDGIDYLKK